MTGALSRYIIKRKDGVSAIDDVVMDREGLSIGRSIKNDLALNHRSVSRVHAGINQIGKDFWIYNLSAANGTLLNGELVERTPLADGDLVQIGPFLLKINYNDDGLFIAVEREIEVNPIAGQTGLLMPMSVGGSETDSTLIVNIPAKRKAPIITPGGTQRLKLTGKLLTFTPGIDEQVIKIFWDKRKREAGKLIEATMLHPKVARRLGKAQFNWQPTLDLSKLWRKSYWVWGALLVGLFALAAAFLHADTFAPAPVAEVHASDTLSARGIALRPNANSCTACHNVVTGVQNQCIDCHNTAGNSTAVSVQTAQSFLPLALISGHRRANVTACNACHTEHQGRASQAGLLNYGLCVNCHNGQYRIEDGARKGELLAVPHGGASVGLPQLGVEYKWSGWQAARWQQAFERWENKELQKIYTPQKLETLPAVGYLKTDQFHLLHYLGKASDDRACVVCHQDNKLDAKSAEGIRSLREACLKCHATSETNETIASLQTPLANCITCHKQHPVASDLSEQAKQAVEEGARSLREVSKFLASVEESEKLSNDGRKSFVAFSGIGSASVIRQEKDALRFDRDAQLGALNWTGWAVGLLAFPLLALVVLAANTVRRKYILKNTIIPRGDTGRLEKTVDKGIGWEALKDSWWQTAKIDLNQVIADGPRYPYPIVNPITCIGCHACVEACPHDVLAIVNGVAVPVAADQCMEDTACQAECPTNPKSCIVINTNKIIPPRKVPARDSRYKTNVDGIYLIGDVSGVPLIKNAINEGAQVIDTIIADLQKEGANPSAEYDVAIIGIGPAGLSAAVLARQRGLRYVAIEQEKVAATIQQTYPAGKYVFYKPDSVQAKGAIPLPGAGDSKEEMLKGWFDAMMQNGVKVNEDESCKDIKAANGGFTVVTAKGALQEPQTYTARRVVIAVGNRGAPLKLGVSGEDIKITVESPAALPKFCYKCGTARAAKMKFCVQCGEKFTPKAQAPKPDSKVKYRLADPDEYVGKKCIVVGAGNSAIEAAVDLTGFKREGREISFTRTNEVTLVIRSDFKGDLKLGNKMNVFDCIDAGRIKVFFGTQIKEITPQEVVLVDGKGNEKARVANDYIFALIGGDRPTKFLEKIGIQIG
ncbi:MAG: NAD(P)-binding domain-containing protein [Acidobacteriota bacterium]